MPASFLHQITEKVNMEPDLQIAKAILLDFLNSIEQSRDVKKMKMIVQYQIHNRDRLTAFVYNNILKYEGHGVV